MKIYYSPDTDSLSIKLRDGGEEVEGHIAGEDLNDQIVVHRDDAGRLHEVEVLWGAREVVDLSRLEVGGLPISANPERPAEKQSRLKPDGTNWNAASRISRTKHTVSRRKTCVVSANSAQSEEKSAKRGATTKRVET